ncbi:hypothetical protein [Streptomyces sp. NPDC054837]
MTEGRDRIKDIWGARTPYDPGTPWPSRADAHLAHGVAEDDVEKWVPSASLLRKELSPQLLTSA